MNKQTTINEDILNVIRIYAEIENKTQVDFTNELLSDALRVYFLKRSGGEIFTVSNPQSFDIDPQEAKTIIAEMMELAIKMSKNHIYVGIGAIANYLETRLFVNTESERKMYEQNNKLDNGMEVK